MKIKLTDDRLKINGKMPRSRIASASGCVTTTLETVLRAAKQTRGFGIITTKSIGPEPNRGHHPPIYCADPVGGPRARRNAVGLSNPGSEEFASELSSVDHAEFGDAIINCSVYGGSYDDFMKVTLDIMSAGIVDSIEDNFSCPNAKGFGTHAGWTLDEKVRIVKDQVGMGLEVFVKETPNMPDDELAKAAKAYVEAGAKGIVVINTVTPAETYLPGTDVPVLFNGKGGGSGHLAKDRGVQCVRTVRDAIGPEPIVIGVGGIFTGQDARDFISAGADFVAPGTGLEMMSSATRDEYIERLSMDVEKGFDSAEFLLPPCDRLHYRSARIDRIDDLSETLRVLRFDMSLEAGPAQYVFLAVPGDDQHPTMEAPLSIPVDDPLALAVRIYGAKGRKHHFTSRVKELEQGQEVFIRGPYGVPFGEREGISRDEHVILVGGGTGTAALAGISRSYRVNTGIFGSRDRGEMLFRDIIDAHEAHGYITADGGVVGELVTEKLRKYPFTERDIASYLVTCGPAPMMKAVMDIAMAKGIPLDKMYAVMEPYMKCGVGICGSCSDYEGNISCTDGHIMRGDKFMEAVRLGKVKRDATGAWGR